MACLAPRAPGDSVRPRRLAGVVARPLNFTVRGHALTTCPRSLCRSGRVRFTAIAGYGTARLLEGAFGS